MGRRDVFHLRPAVPRYFAARRKIGAGDNHAGGVLAGLASGWSLADAVLLGNAVAGW
ncbi:hypothetical protein N898_03520 [Salmonella enterica subsp. arizonae serovar 62:z36:- str. RKS2983]|nr:hypothetical protein N898_03520 [Salmonella enterica subsp. arizonae serovar 62:z36:- str. RKS2983]